MRRASLHAAAGFAVSAAAGGVAAVAADAVVDIDEADDRGDHVRRGNDCYGDGCFDRDDLARGGDYFDPEVLVQVNL